MRRIKLNILLEEKEFLTALITNLSDPNHALSIVLVLSFWLSWGPCIVLRGIETLGGKHYDLRFLHFTLYWIGMLNSCWKALIYFAMSPKFRRGLKYFCLSLCCQRKHDEL